jgi:hypothetical protein
MNYARKDATEYKSSMKATLCKKEKEQTTISQPGK